MPNGPLGTSLTKATFDRYPLKINLIKCTQDDFRSARSGTAGEWMSFKHKTSSIREGCRQATKEITNLEINHTKCLCKQHVPPKSISIFCGKWYFSFSLCKMGADLDQPFLQQIRTRICRALLIITIQFCQNSATE